VSTSATHYQDVPSTDGGGDGHQSYALNGTLSYLVYDGFARKFRVLAAQAGAEATREAHREGQRLLLQAVSSAYYDCLLGRETMLVARKDADFNQALSEETQKRFDAGAAARSDVLNFLIRTTAAESQYVQAAYEYKIARIVLAQLMGLPRGTSPDTLAPMPLPPAQDTLKIPVLEDELNYALAHRPDYLGTEQNVSQLKATLAATKADFLPTVGVGAGYGWSRQGNPRFNDSRDASSYVGIQLTWDAFTGGSTKAQVARQEANIRSLQHSLTLARQAIVSELRQLIESAAVAKKQVELQTRIQTMTEEARKLVRNEYLAGRASLTRLNEAQTDLVKAEGNLVKARIRYWKILEDIAAASAKILIER
jgi:outer membrane protein TolC